MAKLRHLLLGVLLLATSNAVPSPSDNVKTPDLLQKLGNKPESLKSDSPQNPRQKRWYNSYGLPPMSPVYPNPEPFGFTSPDQHFHQIHNRLREISSQIRGLPTFPTFLPVIFIPQLVNCGCRTDNATPKPQNNGTDVDIENRFPEMEDARQNWGFVVNPTNNNIDYSSRPINLEPVRPERPFRPPPPVEHGSSQAGGNVPEVQPASAASPAAAPLPSNARTDTLAPGSAGPPTKCDAAVITCCHRPSAQVTENCFRGLGCNLASFTNACEPNVILSVVSKIQQFYNAGSG